MGDNGIKTHAYILVASYYDQGGNLNAVNYQSVFCKFVCEFWAFSMYIKWVVFISITIYIF